MIRILLFIAIVGSLVYLYKKDGGVNSFSDVTRKTKEASDAISKVSSSASEVAKKVALEAKERMPAASDYDPSSSDSERLNMVAPSSYFPHAKIVSLVEEKLSDGTVRVLKTVETTMKEPYVRIVEIYKGSRDEANRVDQVAMVANQLLLQLPQGMTEQKFYEGLVSAGASHVKKVGEDFLATFSAQPENPRALDEFMARVKKAVGTEVVVEPNYVRKMF